MATLSAKDPGPGNGLLRWWQRTSFTRAAYLYLIPAFLVMGVITFYPMFYQVWMSFTDYNIKNLKFDAPAPNNVGLKNYQDIFQGELAKKVQNFNFWRILVFNLWWVISNVPIHVILGVLIAVLLNVNGLWFKKIYRAVYVLPIILPWLVVATVWRNMFDQDSGSINMLLASIGGLFNVPKEVFRIRWMESIVPPINWILPGQALPLSYYAMLITNIWMGWPYNCIVATGALQSIPKDLYEAASIDGASPLQQFFNITVPLIKPAMIPAAMVGTITTFNLFNCIYFMSSGGPLRKTEILVTTAFDLVKSQRLYGMAAAFCVVIFFVLLGLTLLTNYVTRATESYDVS